MLKDTQLCFFNLLEKTKSNVIEYMQDGKGLYGLKINGEAGGALYVRPDMVVDHAEIYLRNVPSLFHAIPGGKRVKWWSGSTEANLQDSLSAIISEERGVPKPWDNVKMDWKGYIMACNTARGMINSRINKLYSELMPEKHLQILRRYPVNCRNALYPELCKGGVRAWQLAETFPALAWAILSAWRGDDAMRDHALDMVLKGARLRDVAAVVGIPMSFRRFKPALCKHVIGPAGRFLRDYPGLVENHCPATVPRQRAWLIAIAEAKANIKDDAWPVWVAKHGMRLAYYQEVPRLVSDIGDFVRAGVANRLVDQIDPEQVQRVFALMSCKEPFTQQAPANLLDRDPLIPRPFSPDMAPQTVKRLSDQWHEDVSRVEAEKVTFPPAWYQGGTVAGVSIEPIRDHVELSAQARRFRNCAATYSRQIAQGVCYLFTASHEGKPVAMIEIERDNPPRLAQVSGPCNKKPDAHITRAINKWFKERLKVEGNGKAPVPTARPDPANEYSNVPF